MAIEVKDIKLGIAPIGWRNDDIPEIGKENTYKQILSDAALAGYKGTEVGGCYPTDPAELNKELSLRNMEIIGQWFSGFIIRDGVEQAKQDFVKHCEYLKAVNADVAVYSEQTYSIQGTSKCVYTEKPNFTEDEWQVLAEGLNTLGEVALEYGLKLVFHHHMGTGVQTKTEVDKLMEMTDPKKVFLLFDTGHIFVSDGDYMELLRTHIERVAHVHFKDVRSNKLAEAKEKNMSFLDSFILGMFTVPGDGNINFSEVYDFIFEKDYQGWIVIEAEQDPKLANPLEYAIKGMNHLTSIRKFV